MCMLNTGQLGGVVNAVDLKSTAFGRAGSNPAAVDDIISAAGVFFKLRLMIEFEVFFVSSCCDIQYL